MKSLRIYYHEFLNRWYQKAERYHPVALEEPMLCPFDTGTEGQKRAQDQEEEEVTLQGTGEETELQEKMVPIRDRNKGLERKRLVINLNLQPGHGLTRPLSPKWTLCFGLHLLALVQAGAWCGWASS